MEKEKEVVPEHIFVGTLYLSLHFLLIQIYFIFLQPEIKTYLIMTQIIMNAEDVTSPSAVDEEKAFIKEAITRGYLEAQEGRFAGEGLTSLDALVDELRAES